MDEQISVQKLKILNEKSLQYEKASSSCEDISQE